MGQRHNRKRTRSRPRHRNFHSRTSSVASTASSTPIPQYSPFSLPSNRSGAYWHQQYSAWQERLRGEQQKALEAERLRVFGGEAGDEVSLCEPMLRVVMDLFNDIDYVDP